MKLRRFGIHFLLAACLAGQESVPADRLFWQPGLRAHFSAVDADGNTYITDGTNRFYKLNAALDHTLYDVRIGEPVDSPSYIRLQVTAMAPAADGSLYFTALADGLDGFLFHLSADGSRLLTAISLQGAQPSGLVIANDGAVWVGGWDTRGRVATTANAWFPEPQPGSCGTFRPGSSIPCGDGFLQRYSPGLARLEFGTFVRGRGPAGNQTTDAAGVTVFAGSDAVRQLTLAPDGGIVVAGFTTAPNFPVTTGAARSEFDHSEGFLLKVNPLTAAVEWATFIGGTGGDDAPQVIAEADGSLTLIRYRGSATGFSTTQGVLFSPRSFSAIRINGNGTRILEETPFPYDPSRVRLRLQRGTTGMPLLGIENLLPWDLVVWQVSGAPENQGVRRVENESGTLHVSGGRWIVVRNATDASGTSGTVVSSAPAALE
jgi:hypothetical protein